MHTIVTARIKLTLTDGEVIISLFDRSSARDLLERLPRSLDFSDFAGAEKMASLPSLWITTNTPLAASTSSDFTYYAPWGNLAIFFRGYGQEGGIYALGKIELGKEWLSQIRGNFTAPIRRLD